LKIPLKKSEDLYWKIGLFYSSKEEDINLKEKYKEYKDYYDDVNTFLHNVKVNPELI